jgi:hypothetical protein
VKLGDRRWDDAIAAARSAKRQLLTNADIIGSHPEVREQLGKQSFTRWRDCITDERQLARRGRDDPDPPYSALALPIPYAEFVYTSDWRAEGKHVQITLTLSRDGTTRRHPAISQRPYVRLGVASPKHRRIHPNPSVWNRASGPRNRTAGWRSG